MERNVRYVFSIQELEKIDELLKKKRNLPQDKQKAIRGKLRNTYGFFISEYGSDNLQYLLRCGIIKVKDDVRKVQVARSPRLHQERTKITNDFKEGLDPWVGANPKVLILGTLPGDMSLKAQAYYVNVAHNSFWKILRSLFPNSEELRNREFVESLGIALWDCVKSGVRKNSTDAGFDSETLEPNDLAEFLAEHPTIKTVVLNGKGTYANYYCPFFRGLDCKTIVLPSTANTNSIPFEKKLAEWNVLRELLEA